MYSHCLGNGQLQFSSDLVGEFWRRFQTPASIPLRTLFLRAEARFQFLRRVRPIPPNQVRRQFHFHILHPHSGVFPPTTAQVGSANTTIALSGSGFSHASTVNFDGNPVASTFVSAGQLTAVVPASSETVAGNHAITVSNPTPGGGASNSASLSINNLTPAIGSLTPSTIAEGSSDTQIQIVGSNFLSTSTVSLDSNRISSTYISATEILGTIPAGSLSTAGALALVITNPTPGGGDSNPFSIIVSNPSDDILSRDESAPVDPRVNLLFHWTLWCPVKGQRSKHFGTCDATRETGVYSLPDDNGTRMDLYGQRADVSRWNLYSRCTVDSAIASWKRRLRIGKLRRCFLSYGP